MQPDPHRPLLASGTPLPPPPPPPTFQAPPAPPEQSALLPVLAVLVGMWTVIVTVGAAAVGWVVAQVSSQGDLPVPGWFAPALSIFAGAFILAPTAIVIAMARRRAGYPGTLAAGRAWFLAGLAGVVLGCVRATPLPQNEILLGLTAAVAALAGFAVRRRRSPEPAAAPVETNRRMALFPAGAGLLVLAPWLAIGALGGLVETILAGLAAIAVGYLATGILTARFFAAFGRSRRWQILVGGLATGVALAPVAAALGGPGVNLAELVTVPAVAFVAAAVAGLGGLTAAVAIRRRRGPSGLGILLALAVVGPLALVDPEETDLTLGAGDVGTWTVRAAGLGLLVALVLGLLYGLTLRPSGTPRRWLPATVAAIALVACVVVYTGPGRPGFHGEKLFVVMADQADLSGLSTIADRNARLKATYTRLVQTADRTQASLRQELDRFGIAYTPYYLVNGILVDAGPVLRPLLSGRSDVGRVLFDQQLRPLPERAPDETGSQPAPRGAPQWNISAIHADQVWSRLGVTGKGITIGTSDTGVDGSHPALQAGFRGGDDSWYDPWNDTRTPTDHSGHGTHTTGTAVGRDGIGVAPGAQWVGCVNLDRNYGSPSHYLDCLQFMLAPFPYGGDPLRDGRPERAPQILTNSWGCPTIEGCDFDALRPATDALAAAGIYVVVAAGNTGPFCTTVVDAPAPYKNVLTIGAVDRTTNVADFSSRGPTPDGLVKPDLMAPGVDVLSAMPHNTYGLSSGTSMATPHVAGVVALMWSANPKLVGNIAATTKILRDTASPVTLTATGSCGDPKDIRGAGLVNALAAVQAAKAAG